MNMTTNARFLGDERPLNPCANLRTCLSVCVSDVGKKYMYVLFKD